MAELLVIGGGPAGVAVALARPCGLMSASTIVVALNAQLLLHPVRPS